MNQKTEMKMDRLSYDTRWKTLMKDINKHFSLDIRNKNRGRHYVEARWIYYHVCFKVLDYPVVSISKSLNKNHATILYGLKQFDTFIDIDPVFKNKFFNFLKGKQYHFIQENQTKEQLEYQLNMALARVLKLETKLNSIYK